MGKVADLRAAPHGLSRASVIDSVRQIEEQLERLFEEHETRRKELDALMGGARAVLINQGFEQAAQAIFDHCKDLTGATSGYVALLNEDGSENEVLFLDAGGLPCTVDPELPMPIRGLRAQAYQQGRAVYDNAFMDSDWVEYMPEGHVVLRNVLFAPLVIDGEAVGLIGLANKEGDFNENDARLATHFGELAAIALRNSRNLEEIARAARERERMIDELEQALENVRTLRGLLPICANCKKVRDDSGYWEDVEVYVRERSELKFSHSICPACMKELYPELAEEGGAPQEGDAGRVAAE